MLRVTTFLPLLEILPKVSGGFRGKKNYYQFCNVKCGGSGLNWIVSSGCCVRDVSYFLLRWLYLRGYLLLWLGRVLSNVESVYFVWPHFWEALDLQHGLWSDLFFDRSILLTGVCSLLCSVELSHVLSGAYFGGINSNFRGRRLVVGLFSNCWAGRRRNQTDNPLGLTLLSYV